MSDLIKENDPMGYVLVCESFSSDNTIQNLDSKKNADIFYVTFDTNLQDFDVKNRNQRYYDLDNIWECIQTEKIQSLLKTNGWFGEFDHPQPEVVGEKLTPERVQNVPPKFRAFKIMAPRRSGNILQAKIQSAQGQVGEGFAKEIIAGWLPQFSARCIAKMISKNGKPYVQVRRLITYDAVTFPSHAIAHATSEPVVHTKSLTESVQDTIDTAKEKINGIIIPLKEILMDVGKNDVNTQMILESFDLSFDNLVGFDKEKKHAIIRDEDNMIYSNISPDTAKRVNEFYASF